MTISLGGSLPAGDGNGLAAIVSDLIRDPKKYHAVIGIVDTSKITTNRRITLLVCAAGCTDPRGLTTPQLVPLLVCGLLPGHDGKHRDAVWPVEWENWP
jgi:hypothetical protein